MLFISEYQLKPHMPKADVKNLMDELGKRGQPKGRSPAKARSVDHRAGADWSRQRHEYCDNDG
jgi:hypothetical protein